MDAVFYIFSLFCRAGDRSKHPSTFSGAFGFVLFLLPLSFTLVRLFSSHVFDLEAGLASCCSFGPVNARNPLSKGAVLMTYVTMPLTIILVMPMALKAKAIISHIEGAYRLHEPAWWLFVASFGLFMLGPMGASGSETWVWILLSAYTLLFVGVSLALRLLRIHPDGAQK